MDVGYLYVTRNLFDGWVYVGQSSRLDQWSVSQYIGSGDLMRQAILEHGEINFEKEILGHCDNQNELDYEEVLAIARFRAEGFELYNLGVGGPRTDSEFVAAMRTAFGLAPKLASAWYRAVKNHPVEVKELPANIGLPSTEDFYSELAQQLSATQDLSGACDKCSAPIGEVCRTSTGKPVRNHASR